MPPPLTCCAGFYLLDRRDRWRCVARPTCEIALIDVRSVVRRCSAASSGVSQRISPCVSAEAEARAMKMSLRSPQWPSIAANTGFRSRPKICLAQSSTCGALGYQPLSSRDGRRTSPNRLECTRTSPLVFRTTKTARARLARRALMKKRRGRNIRARMGFEVTRQGHARQFR